MSGETITSGITSGGSIYITEYPTLDMQKVTTDNGWWITDYKDTDCILNYSAVKEVFCVLNLNVNQIYHTVNDEQHNEYMRQRDAAAQEIINLMR